MDPTLTPEEAALAQSEQVSDQARLHASGLMQLAARLGLVKPFQVPLLPPGGAMVMRNLKPVTPQAGPARAPTMWRSYASSPASIASTGAASPADPWSEVAAETAKEERIARELGDFSRRVLASKYFVGE